MFKQLETLYAFRHGVYARNKLIDRTGDAAREVVDVPEDADFTMGLLPEGEAQADKLSACIKAGQFAIEACLTSPYLRTTSTASRVMAGMAISIEPDDGLREQDLGFFANIPREVFYTDYVEEAARKKEFPLYWQPKDGKSLLQVAHEVRPTLQRADRLGKEVALSTSAGVMTGLRTVPELGGLTNDQLLVPLAPAIQNPLWIQNVQVDIYTRRAPDTGELFDTMQFFRSIAVDGTEFDTGWIRLPKKR